MLKLLGNNFVLAGVVALILVIIVLFIGVVLVAKVDFPAPNKKIEKVIPNENFKTIK